MYLSTALLSMPVRLAPLANGHGPLGRLSVGFRAKSSIFLAGTQKSCFSRCDAGALSVTRLRRERLRQAADAATASAFFRLLPAPAIRLRFAPAEQRWLRLFFVRSPIYQGIRLFRCVCPPRGPDCRPRPPDETHARPADGNKLRPWPPGRNSAHARAAIPGRAAGHKSGFPGRWCAARRCRRAWWP